MLPSRCRMLAAVLVASSAAACGAASGGATTPSPTATADPFTGTLTVFAAASLTEAFTDAKAKLHAHHPQLGLAFSFAGSQTLVSQVENGAPADVIATADMTTMQKLVAAGLVDAPQTFAHNKLEIVVAPGNPKHVTGLADFARSDLKVILEDPSVPAGKYGRQALQAQGVTARPVSLPLDVKSELLAVEQGNADAGIVYVTDVAAAGSAVTGVTIPDAQNVMATYPVAVVKATTNAGAAQAFVTDVVGGTTHRALLARGFLAP